MSSSRPKTLLPVTGNLATEIFFGESLAGGRLVVSRVEMMRHIGHRRAFEYQIGCSGRTLGNPCAGIDTRRPGRGQHVWIGKQANVERCWSTGRCLL